MDFNYNFLEGSVKDWNYGVFIRNDPQFISFWNVKFIFPALIKSSLLLDLPGAQQLAVYQPQQPGFVQPQFQVRFLHFS